jgi:cytochrome c-type biogenesis protein CcmE
VNKRARTRLIVATIVIVAVFAAGVVYMVSREGAYYRQVSDLSRQDLNGKQVKVAGRVVGGSVSHDAAGLHFALQDLTGKPDVVKVDYAGQVPGAFGAGVDVVVTGKYAAAESLIAADQLQTKCPSKYESQASPRAGSTP